MTLFLPLISSSEYWHKPSVESITYFIAVIDSRCGLIATLLVIKCLLFLGIFTKTEAIVEPLFAAQNSPRSTATDPIPLA